MDESRLNTEIPTKDQEQLSPWITPTFERVDMKDAMTSPINAGHGADGGGFPNNYAS